MKTYNITDSVEFNIYPGTLGVCVSGGVDSALLLYFTLKYSTTRVDVFSVASQDKKLRNTHAAIDVVSKCTELTGNYNLVHHIVYHPSQQRETLFKLPDEQIANNVISMIYTGITKNPPFEVTDNFILPTVETFERDPTIIKSVQQNNCYMPWRNLNKQDMCAIYNTHNLLDTLFPVTRSCEWLNHEWADPGMGHCGKCWWCEERLWGFGKL